MTDASQSLPTLPDELHHLIMLQSLPHHSPYTVKERRRLLRSFSLVSSVWCTFAQEELLEMVWIAGIEAAGRLCSKLEGGETGMTDRKRIKGLFIDDVSALEHELNELDNVVRLCGHVEEVWIGFSVGVDFFSILLNLPRTSPASPSPRAPPSSHSSTDLTSLHLHETSFTLSDPSTCFPHLHHLALTVNYLWRLDYTLLSISHFPSLSSLALTGKGHRLGGPSLAPLHLLAPQLDSLVLGRVGNDPSDPEGVASVLRRCTSLRRFSFCDSVKSFSATMEALPSPLRTLQISLHASDDFPLLVAVLVRNGTPASLAALRELRIVRRQTVDLGKQRWAECRSEVERWCEEREVRFGFMGGRGDLVNDWDDFVD